MLLGINYLVVKMKSKHIIELDSWRGIMALLVAIFHYTVPNNFVSAELAVDFFFILSGIVIQKSYFDKEMSSTEFFIKRLYRLYPLHLFSLIILLFLFLSTVFFVHYPKNGDLLTSFSWQFPADYYKDGIFFTFIQQVLFINGLGFHPHHQYWNGASWSVSCELWVNLIFFIWLRKLSILLIILISIFIYSILFVTFGRLGVHNEYIMFSNQHNYNDFLALIFILVAISISFMQFDTLLNRLLNLRVLVFLGKISYSIYLMHYSVQYVMQSLLGMKFDFSLKGYINLVVFISIVILISTIVYFMVENRSTDIMKKASSYFKIT